MYMHYCALFRAHLQHVKYLIPCNRYTWNKGRKEPYSGLHLYPVNRIRTRKVREQD